MTEPNARILADSISPEGHRLTTVEATFNRFVLAEVNTHRVFSRNSASSRAIPFPKQLVRVNTDPAMPVKWASEQKGMSGGDEIDTPTLAEEAWLEARDKAVGEAEALAEMGVHKSICNRLLEPFMWHTAVITSTAWENFFNLRCSPLAQPEFKVVSEAIRDAMKNSTPVEVSNGQWHLPLVDLDVDVRLIDEFLLKAAETPDHPWELRTVDEALCAVSAARCARVSYLTHDGKRDIAEDIRLYDMLCGNGHSSPLEHVATPQADNVDIVHVPVRGDAPRLRLVLPRYGNFLGWHQHRFDVEARSGYQAFD